MHNNPLTNVDPTGNYCVSVSGKTAHSGPCSNSSNNEYYLSDKLISGMPYMVNGEVRGFYRDDGSINYLSKDEVTKQTFWEIFTKKDYKQIQNSVIFTDTDLMWNSLSFNTSPFLAEVSGGAGRKTSTGTSSQTAPKQSSSL